MAPVNYIHELVGLGDYGCGYGYGYGCDYDGAGVFLCI